MPGARASSRPSPGWVHLPWARRPLPNSADDEGTADGSTREHRMDVSGLGTVAVGLVLCLLGARPIRLALLASGFALGWLLATPSTPHLWRVWPSGSSPWRRGRWHAWFRAGAFHRWCPGWRGRRREAVRLPPTRSGQRCARGLVRGRRRVHRGHRDPPVPRSHPPGRLRAGRGRAGAQQTGSGVPAGPGISAHAANAWHGGPRHPRLDRTGRS